LAKYLTENTTPFTIKALFLVAAPFENDTDNSKEDGGDFAFATSAVGELAKKVGSITLFHSQDDFVVPYEHALKYHEALPEAELVSFTDKNHFLVPELPQLVQKIQNLA
jgi:predicted alpha/beta hydrolase family esterase